MLLWLVWNNVLWQVTAGWQAFNTGLNSVLRHNSKFQIVLKANPRPLKAIKESLEGIIMFNFNIKNILHTSTVKVDKWSFAFLRFAVNPHSLLKNSPYQNVTEIEIATSNLETKQAHKSRLSKEQIFMSLNTGTQLLKKKNT